MFRDRIKELRRVPASQLRAHPKNWRKHPPRQQAALRAVLDNVGYAGAILVRELNDGTLEILDGHLRAEVSPNQLVPVLVLDVSAAEADQILATHDSVSLLADCDFDRLDALADSCRFDSPELAALFRELDEMAREHRGGWGFAQPANSPGYSVAGSLCKRPGETPTTGVAGGIPQPPRPPLAEQGSGGAGERRRKEIRIGESYQIVVTCDSELSQQALYERLVAEGYACRVLVL